MRMYDLIYKKREGEELTSEEISYIIKGYTADEIPDYQLAAWAMAVFFQGMTAEETAHLTREVAHSGDTVDLSGIPGTKVDKHSTGGVGDKTTLVLVPLVAAAGVPVPKMSGRGLGHTGGTIDKLESIPGFQTEIDRSRFLEQVNDIGAAIIGQTGNLTPADKKLYALRDVTATVDSMPLIASSIMGKKIAGGADAIVLDVKTGSGSFMVEREEARKLARLMVEIGLELERKTIALLTDMSQPLGFTVGNALEIKEAAATLKNQGPDDLTEICLKLGAAMLTAGGYSDDMAEAEAELTVVLESGRALEKMREIITAQQGNPEILDNPELLPRAELIKEIRAEESGYISEVTAREIGLIAMSLGAGREKKGDSIDPAAGVEVLVKQGEQVEAGAALARLHTAGKYKSRLPELLERLKQAVKISPERISSKKLIQEIIE